MDNRNWQSILLSVSLLPNKDIKIPNPISHFIIYRISIAVFQICAKKPSLLWYLELPDSIYSQIKMPKKSCPSSFSSMAGSVFDWVATWLFFLLLFFEWSHFATSSELSARLCCPHYYLLTFQSFCHPQIF